MHNAKSKNLNPSIGLSGDTLYLKYTINMIKIISPLAKTCYNTVNIVFHPRLPNWHP